MNTIVHLKNMIRYLLLFAFVISSASQMFSQSLTTGYSNLVVKYEVEFLIDSSDVTSKKNELMTLLIGDHISVYKSDVKASRDSLVRSITKNAVDGARANNSNNMVVDFSKIPRVNLQHEVLYKDDKMLVYDKVFRHVFAYEPLHKVNWSLSKESKMIGKYLCYKAIGFYGQRKFVAWYTPEVPIPEGPYTFKGLPGLIVALNDFSNTYVFRLVDLKKEKREITQMKNAVNTTFEKFAQARQDSKDNAVNQVQSILHRSMSDAEKDIVKRYVNRPTNYLD